MELASNLSDITQEVFQSMLSLEVTPGEPRRDFSSSFDGMVSGMVGMTGLYKCALAIHSSMNMAKKITCLLLFMEEDEVAGEDVLDAMGEMANMLAGNMKGTLGDNGKGIELSVPSAISGDQYALDIKASGEHFIVPFTTEVGNFVVQFHFEKHP